MNLMNRISRAEETERLIFFACRDVIDFIGCDVGKYMHDSYYTLLYSLNGTFNEQQFQKTLTDRYLCNSNKLSKSDFQFRINFQDSKLAFMY